MSYILDALRRADAERERERGAVPGLNAQAAPLSPDDVPARSALAWPFIGAAVALLLVLALLVWWFAPAPAAETVVDAPPTAPPVATAPAFAAPAAPAAPVEPVAVPQPRVTPAAPKAATTPTRAVRSAPAEAPDTASPAPTRVASVADLPAEVRSALPGLAFGGSIYSATPANRLLIVNGQLLHEGDSLGGGATLEQIKPKAAVLRVQGQRFEVGF